MARVSSCGMGSDVVKRLVSGSIQQSRVRRREGILWSA